MVVDVGVVKNHIKPKADSTLRNMRKDDLIEYIRCLENNYNVAVSFNENQAKYIESLDAVKVVRCEKCIHGISDGWICGGLSMMPCHPTFPDCYCNYGERREGE